MSWLLARSGPYVGPVAVYPEELLFEPELVVRGSTGPAPVRTAADVAAAS